MGVCGCEVWSYYPRRCIFLRTNNCKWFRSLRLNDAPAVFFVLLYVILYYARRILRMACIFSSFLAVGDKNVWGWQKRVFLCGFFPHSIAIITKRLLYIFLCCEPSHGGRWLILTKMDVVLRVDRAVDGDRWRNSFPRNYCFENLAFRPNLKPIRHHFFFWKLIWVAYISRICSSFWRLENRLRRENTFNFALEPVENLILISFHDGSIDSEPF